MERRKWNLNILRVNIVLRVASWSDSLDRDIIWGWLLNWVKECELGEREEMV